MDAPLLSSPSSSPDDSSSQEEQQKQEKQNFETSTALPSDFENSNNNNKNSEKEKDSSPPPPLTPPASVSSAATKTPTSKKISKVNNTSSSNEKRKKILVQKSFFEKLRDCCCWCADVDDDELEQFLVASNQQCNLDTSMNSAMSNNTNNNNNGMMGNEKELLSSSPLKEVSTSETANKFRANSNNNQNNSRRRPNNSTSGSRWDLRMSVVEDDQPLATLKMSSNMTLLISKLRMLLTLFIPEAGTVFCQFHPSENASQLVLALEYFIYLQDTLLSPIERLEVIHRALPTSLTEHTAATILIRACKRCALEVANTEKFVEDIRRPGEVYCIRKMLTPSLDSRYEADDPQITLQTTRMAAEKRESIAFQQSSKEFLNANRQLQNSENTQNITNSSITNASIGGLSSTLLSNNLSLSARPAAFATGSSGSNINKTESNSKTLDSIKNFFQRNRGESLGNTTSSNNNFSFATAGQNTNTFPNLSFATQEHLQNLADLEEIELDRKRNERIMNRINTFPSLPVKFSNIWKQHEITNQNNNNNNSNSNTVNNINALSAASGNTLGAVSSMLMKKSADSSSLGGGGMSSTNFSFFGENNASSSSTSTNQATSTSVLGGGRVITNSNNSPGNANAAASSLVSFSGGSSSLNSIRLPKASLFDFLYQWLSADTDCSAILSEKQVVSMLHRLGIFVTLTSVRDLVAAISGSPVPITTYDISTALILYEEITSILALPVFVAPANIVVQQQQQTKNNNKSDNNNNDNKLNVEDQQPGHTIKDVRRFLKEQQFESKERVNLLLSHIGHSHHAVVLMKHHQQQQNPQNQHQNFNSDLLDSEVITGDLDFTSMNKKSTSSSIPDISVSTSSNNRSAASPASKKQQQQQQHQTVIFLPRQLQLLLRDNRVNSWFATESQQVDLKAMSQMSITDFFICASHKSYLAGPQFGAMSVSCEMIAHCLLREACRCIEIDVWEGRKHEPIVTNGGMTSASASLHDVLTVVQRCSFARTSYPLFIVLGVHGGIEFQQRLAQMLKDFFGRRLMRGAKIAKYLERGKPLTPESLRGKILLIASVSLNESENNNNINSSSSSSSSSTFDGTRVCAPALMRLLASHRVETHSNWRISRNNQNSICCWNDVEDPSSSSNQNDTNSNDTGGGSSGSRRRSLLSSSSSSGTSKMYSTSKHDARGQVWTSSPSSRGISGSKLEEFEQEYKKNKEEKQTKAMKRGGTKLGSSSSQQAQEDVHHHTNLANMSNLKTSKEKFEQITQEEDEMCQEQFHSKKKRSSSSSSKSKNYSFPPSSVSNEDDNNNNNSNSNNRNNLVDPLYSKSSADRMLHRLSPNTARIDSSNLDPVKHWLSGANMVALNYQVVNDSGLRMCRDLFLGSNGGIGLIPKPTALWRRNISAVLNQQQQQLDQSTANNNIRNTESPSQFSTNSSSGSGEINKYRPPALPQCQLRVEVLAASLLPPPLEVASFNAGSGFSVLIQLIVHEVKFPDISSTFSDSQNSGRNSSQSNNSSSNMNNNPQQQKQQAPSVEPPNIIAHRYRTQLIQDNLHSPTWDDEIWELEIDHPNCAVLTVQALACRHEEDLATPMLVGERSIFVHQLQQGVRMVPLIGQDGLKIDHPYCGILCRFSLTPTQPFFVWNQQQQQQLSSSSSNITQQLQQQQQQQNFLNVSTNSSYQMNSNTTSALGSFSRSANISGGNSPLKSPTDNNNNNNNYNYRNEPSTTNSLFMKPVPTSAAAAASSSFEENNNTTNSTTTNSALLFSTYSGGGGTYTGDEDDGDDDDALFTTNNQQLATAANSTNNNNNFDESSQQHQEQQNDDSVDVVGGDFIPSSSASTFAGSRSNNVSQHRFSTSSNDNSNSKLRSDVGSGSFSNTTLGNLDETAKNLDL